MFIRLSVLAFVLDLLFKDPKSLPHPVRYIGKLLDSLEKVCRKMEKGLKVCGVFALLSLCLFIGCFLWFCIKIPYLGLFLAIYFSYAGLSLGELISSGKEVLSLLEKGCLKEARQSLGLLVSRKTDTLDEQGAYRTLAETLSENFNDGFVAPFFYLLLGGPVLLWIYKILSTADSMWGYKHPEWKELGWAGARADDFLGWLPARLSWLLLVCSSLLLGLDWKRAFLRTRKQARQMESPNAGWPMAAAAWSVQASMGGEAEYREIIKQKPVLGPENAVWNAKRLNILIKLLYAAASLNLLLALALGYTLASIF